MKTKKQSRVFSVLLVMVTAISLLSGCGEKSAEKEDAETITVYLWSTNLYEKYAPYIQEQLPDVNVEKSEPGYYDVILLDREKIVITIQKCLS